MFGVTLFVYAFVLLNTSLFSGKIVQTRDSCFKTVVIAISFTFSYHKEHV